jgi:hypothetical protein
MSQPTTPIKLALLSCASWACTLLLYLAGIMVTAASLQRAQTSTASTAALVLIAAEVLVACISIAFVLLRSRGTLQAATRFGWVAAFAVLQLGTCAVAVLATLLALNR